MCILVPKRQRGTFASSAVPRNLAGPLDVQSAQHTPQRETILTSDTHSMNEPSERTIASDLGEAIAELRAEMARLSDEVQAYLQHQAEELRHGAAETTAEVEELVRDHPLPAVGIAFGAGLVLGLLIRGRPRPQAPRLSRRDFERLASRLRGAFEVAPGDRLYAASADGADRAFLERLSGALSGLIQSSRSTAASVGSAGERAARTVAAAGERTARAVSERLSHAVG